MAKTAVLELKNSAKLISRKIWVMEKLWNFHTVERYWYLPHYTHSNRLKQVQLTDYLCWFRWQEADRQLEAAVWPSSWPRDYLNETFWSAPYIGVTYHWIGKHGHPSIRKVEGRKDCQKRPLVRWVSTRGAHFSNSLNRLYRNFIIFLSLRFYVKSILEI